MSSSTDKSYAVTAEINIPANDTYRFMSEPFNLGKWAFGCWNTETTNEDGLYCGTSLFDKEKMFFKIKCFPEILLIDFLVGEREALKARISARIIPADVYEAPDDRCLLTLTAWRGHTMTESRWKQLCMCHETEILLLKNLIETSD